MRKLRLREFKLTHPGLHSYRAGFQTPSTGSGVCAYNHEAWLSLNIFLVFLFSCFHFLLRSLSFLSFPLSFLPFPASFLSLSSCHLFPLATTQPGTPFVNSLDPDPPSWALPVLPSILSFPCASAWGMPTSTSSTLLLTTAAAVGRGLGSWGLGQPGGKPDLWGVTCCAAHLPLAYTYPHHDFPFPPRDFNVMPRFLCCLGKT